MDKKRVINAAVTAGLSLSMILTSVPATAFASDEPLAQDNAIEAQANQACRIFFNITDPETGASLRTVYADAVTGTMLDWSTGTGALPDHDGYTVQWSDGVETYNSGDRVVVTGDHTFTTVWTPVEEPAPEPEYDADTVTFICGDETYTITLTESADHTSPYCFDEFVDVLERDFPAAAGMDWVDENGNAINSWLVVDGDMTAVADFDEPVADSGTVYFQVADQTYTITLTNPYDSSFDEYVDELLDSFKGALDVEGYDFKGWVDENGNAVDQWLVIENGTTITVKANLVETPAPVATHTVTFMDENGEWVGAVTRGGDQALSTYLNDLYTFDMSREGYTLRWTTKSGDEVKEGDIISGDITLYAHFDAIHTVNFFDKDGNGLGTVALSGDLELSEYVEALEEIAEIPFVDGYTFTGWATKSGNAVLSNDVISGDLNLYAQYSENPNIYTVNFFDENGKGICTIALPGENNTLQDFVDALYQTDGVEVPFKDGCYIEWTTKSGDVVANTDLIWGTINLYASFKESPATHTINFFDADGNGLGTVALSGDQPFSAYVDGLTEMGVEAPYRDGYTFTGWATKSGDSILNEDVISGDINVYAQYEQNAATHTINFFDEDGNGLGTVANTGELPFSTYTDMLAEIAEVPEKDGYIFAGWVTASGDAILANDIIAGDLNLYASYEKVEEPVVETHKVTFDDCLESTENRVAVVVDGDTVARPADPACEGYTFLGWFSDTALTQAWDFNTPVTSDMTLWAKWEKNADVTAPVEDAETPQTPEESQAAEAEKAESEVPETGDATNATAVAGIGIAGLVAAAASFILRRRNEQ